MTFDFNELRDILVCPKCKSKLVLDAESLVCTQSDCRLQYAIRDEIPIMLIDEADELSPEDWSPIIERHAGGAEVSQPAECTGEEENGKDH